MAKGKKTSKEKMLEQDADDRKESIARRDKTDAKKAAQKADLLAAVGLRKAAIVEKYGPHVARRISAGFIPPEQVEKVLALPVDPQ